jgi:hypothetical protein
VIKNVSALRCLYKLLTLKMAAAGIAAMFEKPPNI